ncbi:MAG: imidazole glycerol phosphate synthase subunit HisH [Myxococcota bacterium]
MAGSTPRVAVLETGTSNIASVLAALRRVGAEPFLTSDVRDARDTERVMLPGVGAFGAAMRTLRDSGLAEAVAARVREGRPLLAVCLGLQLLCESSEESPGVEGLGVVPGTVRRFSEGVMVPHFGWNRVVPAEGACLLEEGYAYFANSYRLEAIPEGWSGATCEHGGPFVAALERGPVLACQFHPELSGAWGENLLRRWMEA